MWNSAALHSLLVSGATLCATSTTSVQLYAIVGNYVSPMCNPVQVLCPTMSKYVQLVSLCPTLQLYVQLCAMCGNLYFVREVHIEGGKHFDHYITM